MQTIIMLIVSLFIIGLAFASLLVVIGSIFAQFNKEEVNAINKKKDVEYKHEPQFDLFKDTLKNTKTSKIKEPEVRNSAKSVSKEKTEQPKILTNTDKTLSDFIWRPNTEDRQAILDHNHDKEFIYRTYLFSDFWKKKKDLTLERDKYVCQICSTATDLEVHHITYQRLYMEDSEDLVTLCRDCHQAVHDYHPKYAGYYPINKD